MGVKVACIMELSALFHVTLFLFRNNPKLCFLNLLLPTINVLQCQISNVKTVTTYYVTLYSIVMTISAVKIPMFSFIYINEVNEIPSAGYIHCLNLSKFDMSSDMNCELARGWILDKISSPKICRPICKRVSQAIHAYQSSCVLLQDVRVFTFSYFTVSIVGLLLNIHHKGNTTC